MKCNEVSKQCRADQVRSFNSNEHADVTSLADSGSAPKPSEMPS